MPFVVIFLCQWWLGCSASRSHAFPGFGSAVVCHSLHKKDPSGKITKVPASNLKKECPWLGKNPRRNSETPFEDTPHHECSRCEEWCCWGRQPWVWDEKTFRSWPMEEGIWLMLDVSEHIHICRVTTIPIFSGSRTGLVRLNLPL